MMQHEFRPNRPNIKPAIQEFIDKITFLYHETISDVILYGSVARGEDTEQSDIDLLVIGRSDDWKFERELIDIAYDIGLEYGLYLSIKYMNKDEYERSQSFSFFKNIQGEGISIVS